MEINSNGRVINIEINCKSPKMLTKNNKIDKTINKTGKIARIYT